MVIGRVIHQTLSVAYRYKLGGEMMSFDGVMKYFDKFWELEASKNVIWGEDPENLKDVSKKLIEIYYNDIMPRYIPVASEQKYETTIAAVPYRGIIDLEIKPVLFDDDPRIVEFKIRKRTITTSEANKDIQISSYGLLKGGQPLVAEFHVGLMQKKPDWRIVRTERREDDYRFLCDMVKQTHDLVVKSGDFIPNVSFWGCAEFDEETGSGCPYWELCHLV
jgi:hypothetical protein